MKKTINKIRRTFGKYDKFFHFIVNFLIVVVFGFFFGFLVGVLIAVIFSIVKEAWDTQKHKYWGTKEGVSKLDMIFNVLGIVIGLLILLYIRIILSVV